MNVGQILAKTEALALIACADINVAAPVHTEVLIAKTASGVQVFMFHIDAWLRPPIESLSGSTVLVAVFDSRLLYVQIDGMITLSPRQRDTSDLCRVSLSNFLVTMVSTSLKLQPRTTASHTGGLHRQMDTGFPGRNRQVLRSS
jgi:hypothetical protein